MSEVCSATLTPFFRAEPAIEVEIAGDHAAFVEPGARDGAARLGVDGTALRDGARHGVRGLDEETGPARQHRVAQGAVGRGDDGRPAGRGLAGHERRGLLREAGHEKASGRGEQPALPREPHGSDEPAPPIEQRPDLGLVVIPMRRIGIEFARDQQRDAGTMRRLQRQVNPLLRTDPPEEERETAFGMMRLEFRHRDAVLDGLQKTGRSGTSRVLRRRDAVEPCVGPPRVQGLGRIPSRWQMKGCQDRRTGSRQVAVEIDAMEVHEVHGLAGQHGRDRSPVAGLRFALRRIVEHAFRTGDRLQLARDAGTLGCHDDGAMSGRHEGPVQDRQDLLGASGRIGRNARQRIADAQHREAHGGKPRSASAVRTSPCQRSPVRFQPWRS